MEHPEPECEGLEKKVRAAGGIRRNLYEHVTLSKRTLDIIIAVCALLIFGLTVLGVLIKPAAP
ncbi:MAG: hypothetical protein LBC90_06710 [Candidatus Adiutrix sp.]|jgi:lipopolysaccharide/colanic/teichoic acid biosynthesis glycosyltransferase|nr:hypothetical protein [Candidatus Adiutrix sp.]